MNHLLQSLQSAAKLAIAHGKSATAVPTAEELEHDYVTLDMSQHEIAAKWGLSQSTVSTLLRRHGIPTRPARIRPGRKPNRPLRTGRPAYNRAEINAGDRFGRLLVLGFSHRCEKGHRRFSVRCDCGVEKLVMAQTLKGGETKSCGCYFRESKRQPRLTRDVAATNTSVLRYTRGAAQRGIAWKLSWDDVRELIHTPCTYCGDPGSNTLGGAFHVNGIDRVDNDRCYEIDNVVACCKRCNRSKAKQTKDEFVAWALRIASRCGQ